jgi:hypothetical protein
MARSTLEAVFGALGAGLQGYGADRRQRNLDEERRRREALGDSLTAADMLASGRFGTEAQVMASSGNAFRTAGQLASGAMAPTGKRVLPSAEEMSNLGASSRRGAAPPVFEVGGQRLGLLRTAADEEREAANRQIQNRAVAEEREQGVRAAELETQFGRQKELIALEGRENRATAQARTIPSTVLRPPTEGQERNAVYFGLMSNAMQELDALQKDPTIRPWAITTYLNTPGATFGRGILNDAEQQFIRAAQDFTAGVLRKETGAAATKSEVAMTLERYIEMGGDQPGSRQAKSDARTRVTSMMEKAASPALRYYASLEDTGDSTATDRTQARPPLSSFWEN